MSTTPYGPSRPFSSISMVPVSTPFSHILCTPLELARRQSYLEPLLYPDFWNRITLGFQSLTLHEHPPLSPLMFTWLSLCHTLIMPISDSSISKILNVLLRRPFLSVKYQIRDAEHLMNNLPSTVFCRSKTRSHCVHSHLILTVLSYSSMILLLVMMMSSFETTYAILSLSCSYHIYTRHEGSRF